MTDQPTQRKRADSRTGAGAAGVGGGTVLVALANALPEDNPLRIWFLLAAPAVSISLSVVWLWCQAELANYMQRRKLAALERTTREALERALNNPNTSDRHRNLIRRKLEQAELIIVDHHLENLESVSPVTVADVIDIQAKVRQSQDTA